MIIQKELIEKVNKLLEKICKKLFKDHFFDFNGSYNYSVSVKVFSNDEVSNDDEIDLIEKILNTNAEVGEIEECGLSELLNSVKKGFEYNGDEGSFPNRKYLLSVESKTDLESLLEQLEFLFSDNLGIFKFWLKAGHPFYPVYWDYAYLVKKNKNNLVLVGSSSD